MAEDKSKLYGFYRAKVVNNVDPKKCGRTMVWIPDVMPKVEETKGLWAHPGNNPISGLNSDGNSEHYYSGSCYVPPIGCWIWVFFENGNPNRPFYFSGLDLQNTMVLPECQTGEYQHKWVIFKSHEGRCIVISDDPSDCRVEITGKKRQMSSPPVGDTSSVYTIDGNQTTIFFDERDGSEKILVRTYKGDYINIDVTNQKLNANFTNDINLKTAANFNIQAGGDINIKSSGNTNNQSGGDTNILAGGNVNIDGATINEKSGMASPATDATPTGSR